MFVFSLCNADPPPHPHTHAAKTIQPDDRCHQTEEKLIIPGKTVDKYTLMGSDAFLSFLQLCSYFSVKMAAFLLFLLLLCPHFALTTLAPYF